MPILLGTTPDVDHRRDVGRVDGEEVRTMEQMLLKALVTIGEAALAAAAGELIKLIKSAVDG
jgi:hypothetical protein